MRRHYIKVARTVQVRKILIRNETKEPNAVSSTSIVRQGLKSFTITPCARNEVHKLREISFEIFKQRYNSIMAFVALNRVQAADGGKNGCVHRYVEPFPRRCPVTGRKTLINGVVDDLASLMISASDFDYLVGGMLTDTKDQI